ncbi:MAG TPA: transcription antitermination factor NusB [Syntrophales bacterium]|nr:transcription antitermination factor NusB [Syntrophales bacterium]HOP35612.1 transcription antitermination factor NusB [Syntrophales bacterium]
MGRRRKAREIALQVLYQIDVTGLPPGEAMDLFWEHFDAPDYARPFCARLIEGTREHRDAIDERIRGVSSNWSMERMAIVDRNILRMAVFELLYCRDIPPKVAINEAIDLGKEYGTENSGSFINGILDALFGNLQENHGHQDIIGAR